jgi:hypothetical protein
MGESIAGAVQNGGPGRSLREFNDCEPKIITAELYDPVLDFSQGTPEKDDLTAVLIKRLTAQTAVA